MNAECVVGALQLPDFCNSQKLRILIFHDPSVLPVQRTDMFASTTKKTKLCSELVCNLLNADGLSNSECATQVITD